MDRRLKRANDVLIVPCIACMVLTGEMRYGEYSDFTSYIVISSPRHYLQIKNTEAKYEKGND
jgi:hypothetical protein